ncbi:MAG: PilZ domain-containing protein [Desulfobacterales bacterium]
MEYTHEPERRDAPRMPYCTPAQYTNASVDGAGTVTNISSNGMFLETPHPLKVGDQISIAFQFRNSKHPMNIDGQIARLTETGVGVQFLWT